MPAQALDIAAASAWVDAFGDEIEASHEELTELDRLSGDGDFGSNVHAALGRARATLAGADVDSVGEVFAAVSTAFMQAGGTSGPLFGIWFREFARAGAERQTVGLDVVATAISAGTQAVQRMGGAGMGDKTMVDAMAPAAEVLVAAAAAGGGLGAALGEAARAARTGAESTADLLARRGRASYVGDAARGVLDPGAVTVALFFEAAPAPR